MIRLIMFLLLQSILMFSVSWPVVTLPPTPFHGNETDKLALLALKSGINSQGIMLSWNDSISFCKWEGVRCSLRHQRVIMLNLSSQGLSGTISPYIGNLSFMKTINLTNNNFQGEIPQEIGSLVRLQVLDMGNNSFSGQIPVNMSQCSNLASLILHQNKLTGKIPEEFGFFSKLSRLSLYRNNLTGGIPASLGNLTSMEYLKISENSLSGGIPDSFGQYRRLSFLSVTANMLSGMVPPSLYNITSLTVLSISVNRLEGEPPQDIGQKLPNLQTFFIGENRFSGSIPVSLFTNTSGLVAVSFGNNSFTGEVPIEVGNANRLELFVLQDNYLGSGGELDDIKFLTSLSNCTNLVRLDIHLNHLGGRLPSSISNLSQNLYYLDLGENQIFGSIPTSIGELKGLLYFSVPSNILTGEIPIGIGMLQNLQNVVLSRNNLSGRIPYSIGNISSLYSLDLSYNSLEGSIVTSLERCPSLQELKLDHNHLTGIVPKEVVGLSTQLTNINLSHNDLTGSLPSEVGNLKNLQLFDVSVNKISGEIPGTFGNCFILEILHLQDNFLQGSIPTTFQYMKGIQDINLSRNNLSGKIPKDLENLLYLKSLDLSFNKLEGEVPIGRIFQNMSAFSVVGNNNLCGGATKLNLQKCYRKKTKEMVMSPALKVILGVLLPSIVILSLLRVLHLMKKPKTIPTSQDLTQNFPRISYGELYDATQGFSPETLIGTGSYGSVYRGVLQKYGSPVAVKVLKLTEKGASKSFVNECEVLKGVRHRNLVKIVTVCSSMDFEGNDFKALIFEFMPNGSLESWLYPSSNRSQQALKVLNLVQRFHIAMDVAYALDYLHNQCETPIVHCDLKPSNVLIDHGMVAYVGDFGLAKFLLKNITSSDESGSKSVVIRGTIGYIPPEYGMGGDASTQGDMYSYGILLLEMFTGKRPTDAMFNENVSLRSICKENPVAQVMEILHTSSLLVELPSESTNSDTITRKYVTNEMKEALISIIEIGVNCSSDGISERMDIRSVLTKMLKLKELFYS